jgi:hypothetical protein
MTDDLAVDPRVNDRAGTPASATEFRAFLTEIGESQSGFARTLKLMGDDRLHTTILRHIQRMATGEARVSGEMRVIMAVFRDSHRKKGAGADHAGGDETSPDGLNCLTQPG